jgi:hypothetical protein
VVGLFAAIRTGLWRVIGNIPPSDFVYPKFLSFWSDVEPGRAKMWFLWDGSQYTKIGKELPEEYRNLELTAAWAPKDLMHRIQTGENPFENIPKRY